jgi:hypothetical protein
VDITSVFFCSIYVIWMVRSCKQSLLTRCFCSNKIISTQLPTSNDDIITIASSSNTCSLYSIMETIQTIDHRIQSVDDNCYKQQNDLYHELLAWYHAQLKRIIIMLKKNMNKYKLSIDYLASKKKVLEILFDVRAVYLLKSLNKRSFICITALLLLQSIMKPFIIASIFPWWFPRAVTT